MPYASGHAGAQQAFTGEALQEDIVRNYVHLVVIRWGPSKPRVRPEEESLAYGSTGREGLSAFERLRVNRERDWRDRRDSKAERRSSEHFSLQTVPG